MIRLCNPSRLIMHSRTFFLLAGVLLAGLARAGDPAIGEKMVKEHACATCHQRLVGGDGSALYTRSDRKVTSKAKLGAQVSFVPSSRPAGFPKTKSMWWRG
jgi:cytochrome c551/c552